MADDEHEDSINNVGELPSPGTSGGSQQSGDLSPIHSSSSLSPPSTPLQASFPEAGTYTVQFNVAPPQGLPSPGPDVSYPPIFIEALITWSVGGGSVNRRVSVTNGTSVTGVGEGVTVRVFDASPQLGEGPYVGPLYAAYPDGTTYTVQVSVARGSRASNTQQPTLSRWQWQNVELLKSGTELIQIPSDAGAINVFSSLRHPAAGAGGFVAVTEADIQAQQVVAPATIPVMAYYPRELEWFPLVPGCTGINYQNSTNASATAIYVSTWFGIDG